MQLGLLYELHTEFDTSAMEAQAKYSLLSSLLPLTNKGHTDI